MEKIKFDWADFYQAFANRLLDFKDDRTDLIVKFKKIYDTVDMKWSCLEKDFEGNFIDPKDIDPFTVVGIFNRRMKDENRMKIIKVVKEEFSISEELPTGFHGIPRIRSDVPRFYAYEHKGRKEDDIDNLWKVFEAAINLADNDNVQTRNEFIKWFNVVKDQKGVGLSYFTTGLFWIRPYKFINLDSRNLKFLAESNLFSKDLVDEIESLDGFPSGELYLRICDESALVIENSDYENLIDFSYNAFLNDVNDKPNKNKREVNNNDSSETVMDNNDSKKINYWLISPGAGAEWWDECYQNDEIGISFRGTGDLSKYNNVDEIKQKLQQLDDYSDSPTNDARGCWQFVHEMKKGDVVFAKKGRKEIIGRGIVESDYKYDKTKSSYHKFRKVNWTHNKNCKSQDILPIPALTNITNKPYLENIKKMFEDEKYDSFYDYLMAKGYYFSSETIENYLLSLKVKPFVILTGNSGTGKTKLSQLFAKYLNENGRYEVVPVGANWTENRHILGYHNILNGEDQYTPSYHLIKHAGNNLDIPHFLILDEMNLSHVERYFADILSAIESEEPIPLHNEKLKIEKNLFIVGTVNVDETTYMFSPKVLDRANTIEFKTSSAKKYMEDELNLEKPMGNISFLENVLEGSDVQKQSIKELRIKFPEEIWEILSDELEYFQNILQESGFDFGFRVINEIVRFMAVAYEYEEFNENWDWQRYFDAQIKQKMLPKLHGSQKMIGKTLKELSEACENYPFSKAKIEEMNKVLQKQRYVSFIN